MPYPFAQRIITEVIAFDRFTIRAVGLSNGIYLLSTVEGIVRDDSIRSSHLEFLPAIRNLYSTNLQRR